MSIMSIVIFVNQLLNILYGRLPSYCYYTDEDDISCFFNNLTPEDYEKIYNYLLLNEEIVESDGDKREIFENYIREFYNFTLIDYP